jgi:hypothetical protein
MYIHTYVHTYIHMYNILGESGNAYLHMVGFKIRDKMLFVLGMLSYRKLSQNRSGKVQTDNS